MILNCVRQQAAAMAAIGAWVGVDMAIAACLMVLFLKVVDWFLYRTEGADVGSSLGVELAVAGIAAFAFL